MKICSKCEIEKCESEFRIRKDRPCGLRSQCRACDSLYEKSHAGRASEKKYRESPNGRKHALLRMKRFQKTSKGKQTRKRYSISEKGRIANRRSHIRRRDLEYELVTDLSRDDIKIVFERFKSKCFNCETDKNLTIDHHYPLSRGNALTISNAVLLCQSCNSSKYNKMPEEFYSKDKLVLLSNLLSEFDTF